MALPIRTCETANNTCLNNGQCRITNDNNSWSCVCHPCYIGSRCEEYDNLLFHNFPSAMLINIRGSETVNYKLLYTFCMCLIGFVGLLNNIITLQTIYLKRLRSSYAGVYLLVYTISATYITIWMQVRTMPILYGHKSITQSYTYQYLSCYIFGTIHTILTSVSLWISAALAFERTLIELFFFQLFATTRKHAIIISLIFFIFILLCRVPTILGKKVLSDPTNVSLFICTFRMSPLLTTLEHIQAWINMIGPCFVHFLSNILTCISIARRKVYLSNSSNNRLTCWQAWSQQISLHRDYFVCPLIIILCELPPLIFFAITETMHPCLEPKLSLYSHLHIASALLINVPQILTFFICIYPSKCYMSDFYSSTLIGRSIQKLKGQIH